MIADMKIIIPCRRYNKGGKKVAINLDGKTFIVFKNEWIDVSKDVYEAIIKIEPRTHIVSLSEQIWSKKILRLAESAMERIFPKKTYLPKQSNKPLKFKRYGRLDDL